MGSSRVSWAGLTMAPWVLALGMLVTITAQANQDPYLGGRSISSRSAPGIDDAVFNGADGASLISARYVVGAADELSTVPDEIDPRKASKGSAWTATEINRTHKGDPFVALRPGIDARATGSIHAAAREEDFPQASMSPAVAPETVRPVIPFTDGATPAVPLDRALVAVSPSPSDGKLAVGVVRGPALAPPQGINANWIAANADLSDRPVYATLIDPKTSARQMRCLAEAIYFESRSEPEAGQAAVAQVVLNRVRSGIYPTDVCGVVYQDRQRPFACQFSFACEGKSLRVEEPGAWATATRIADDVVQGRTFDPRVVAAINYHAAYVTPFWASTLRRVDRIGLHVFYSMRPGLYWAPGALNGRGDLPPLQASAKVARQPDPAPATSAEFRSRRR